MPVIANVTYKYQVDLLHETPTQRWVTSHGVNTADEAFKYIREEYKRDYSVKSYEILDDNGTAPIEFATPY